MDQERFFSERETFTAGLHQKEREYWKFRLSGELEKSRFFYDHKEMPVRRRRQMTTLTYRLDDELADRAKRLIQGRDHRLHILIAAAVTLLLFKYNGHGDVMIAVPVYAQAEKGNFINTLLPLRNYVDPEMSFRELVSRVRETVTEAVEHQNYPLEAMIRLSNLPAVDGEFPLFDVAVAVEPIHESELIQPVPLNMIWWARRADDGIEGRVEYNTALFKKNTILGIIDCYIRLLRQGLSDLDAWIAHLDILSPSERRKLLFDLNEAESSYPWEKTIQGLFHEQVRRHPRRIALVFGEHQLCYQRLNERSDRLARLLRSRGVGPETIAAILLERSPLMVEAILAVLKSGAAYLPIDPDYPEERIRYVLDDSGAAEVLIDRSLTKMSRVKQVLRLDQAAEVMNRLTAETIRTQPVNPLSLAYVIYTSGTTGKPKGVMIRQHNVVQLLFHRPRLFHFSDGDVWTLFHSFCFDFSVWEMYGALLYGGRLVLVSRMAVRDPGGYLKILKREGVTVLNQTPTAFYNLVDEELMCRDKALYLKYIIFGGEALAPIRLKEWRTKYPEIRLINMFGITETTVHVTFKEIGGREIEHNISNIGNALPTLGVYIMDAGLNLLPFGAAGEMCVGGAGVGRGYLNRPELTALKFTPNPYLKGQRLYRSGDLVRWLENGEMEYLGRIDQQVKIRGFRIELAEVESRLLKHSKVKEAVVLVRERVHHRREENKNGDKRLSAYIVARSSVTDSEIREYLFRFLPEYMIPAQLFRVDRFPLTVNGKIDRRALEQAGMTAEDQYVAPRSPEETRLVEIWETVLGIEREQPKARRIGVTDNYFQSGGDSISVIRLINLINEELETHLSVADIYEYDTVEKLARHILQQSPSGSADELKKVYEEIEDLKRRILAEKRLPKPDQVEDIYPLSDIEKGMTFYSLKEAAGGVYHDQFVYQRNYPDFNFATFRQALTLMVDKHPILRTCFRIDGFDEPVQVVYRTIPLDILHQDLSHLSREEQQAYLRDYLTEDRKKAFEVAMPPLWRMRIFSLAGDRIAALWIFHHAILDGWSNASLLTELNNTYLRLSADPHYVPARLKNSYKAYVAEQIAEKRKEEVIGYWENELAGYRRLVFPGLSSQERQKQKGATVKKVAFDFGSPFLQKLRELEKKYDTSVKNLCFAAYLYMLYMNSYDNDFAAGLLTNNRPVCEDGDQILGCFLNSVPFRVIMPANITWEDYIVRIDRRILELKRYERLSLMEIVKITGERTEDRNPLFDTLLNFIDFRIFNQVMSQKKSRRAENTPLQVEGHENVNTLFDVTVNTVFGVFQLYISYDPSFFDQDFVMKSGYYFKAILNRFIETPGAAARKNEIIPEEERRRLLVEFNKTDMTLPGGQTIRQLLEEQVKTGADAVAAAGRSSRSDSLCNVSYGELHQRAGRLARILKADGVCVNMAVGILAGRTPEMLIALWAVLRVGGAYLAIDPGLPAERIRFMLEDGGIRNIVTDQPRLPGDYAGKIVPIDPPPELSPFCPGVADAVGAEALFYIIYTSGSTGHPKGVSIRQRGFINLIHSHRRVFGEDRSSRISQVASPAFDAMAFEIWPCLTVGAALLLARDDVRADPAGMKGWLIRHQVTISFQPTLMAEQLLLQEWRQSGSSLRVLRTAGDRLSLYPPGKLPFRFYNLYGPTEDTVWTTFLEVESSSSSGKYPAIGRPVDNHRVFILGMNRELQPVGVPGELCIGGQGLAKGYVNRPELTAEKFILYRPLPDSPRSLLYRSGDLARWLPDGNLEFLGRIDDQLKIRGFRIELGEIEHQLLRYVEIVDAAVIARPSRNGEKYLCAYFVSPRELEISELKQHLSGRLPGYMIPVHFARLEKLPLNPSGKIDRRALADIEISKPSDSEYVPPRNETERRIIEIWQQAMDIDKIGIFDDFFESGGDSLKAMQVVLVLAKDFEITVTQVYQYRTAARLAGHIVPREDNLREKIQEARRLMATEEVDGERREARVRLMEAYQDYKDRVEVERLKGIKTAAGRYRHILITGATGYLGAHLVRELIHTTDAGLYLLVRGESAAEAQTRLSRKFHFYFGEDLCPVWGHRLEVVTGELRSDCLGIPTARYRQLTDTVEAVVHAAANVKHFGPYEDFYEDNVAGTRRLLDFCRAGKPKDFHYISTLSLGYGNIESQTYDLFSEYSHPADRQFQNFYVRSKAEAERLVLSNREKELRTSIYRVGNLVFHSGTGKFQENIEQNAFYANLKILIQQGVVPDNGRGFDMTFIDQAARAVALLLLLKGADSAIFHIQNHQRISWPEMDRYLEAQGIKIQVLPPPLFLDFLLEHLDSDEYRNRADRFLLHSGLFDKRESKQTLNMVVSDRTRKILDKLGFRWSKVTETHIRQMIEHCRTVGFLS